MEMLKIVRIHGQPVTLRSVNGKDWFLKPKCLLEHKRKRAAQRQQLQHAWATVDLGAEIGASEDTYRCFA